MTRKRFIKLVMAMGIQRNQARTIATSYCIRGVSYKKAYKDFLTRRGISLAIKHLANACNMLGSNLKIATASIERFKETISNNIRSELINDR